MNLLQPQDRRSAAAGDSRAAVAARARLLRHGIAASTLDAVAERVVARVSIRDVVVDLGSGSGELLGIITAKSPAAAIGIDLSTAACEYAAKRFPNVLWAVANADRRLPLLDRSVDVVLSVHGRRNPAECARVLAEDGVLIIAVPGPEDLIELREYIHGERHERDRSVLLVQEHVPFFALVEKVEIREQRLLPAELLRDLLRGTYRGERLRAQRKADALDKLQVTLSSAIVTFRKLPKALASPS